MTIFEKLDSIITDINHHKVDPQFTNEINSRNNRYETTVEVEKNNLLRVMATLIAFSNNAPSDSVANMLDNGVFEKVFHNFDLVKVSELNPESVVANEWDKLRVIRFKKKVEAIIKCAKLLIKSGQEKATIESLFKSYNLPKDIKSESDIDKFWEQFDRILAYYKRIDMPYFKNYTTLLHLLLHLGFPCIKPDLIVMKVAASIGIVKPRDDHNTYSDYEKINVVQTIQKYCLLNKIKPAVIDTYLLIYGGQKYYLGYVNNSYTRLQA